MYSWLSHLPVKAMALRDDMLCSIHASDILAYATQSSWGGALVRAPVIWLPFAQAALLSYTVGASNKTL